MKGVPTQSILSYCESNKITPFELYEKLYKGECIEFDLCSRLNDNGKCERFTRLKRYNNFEYHNIENMTRKICFENKSKK